MFFHYDRASPLRAEGSGETPRRRQAQGNAHQERGQKAEGIILTYPLRTQASPLMGEQGLGEVQASSKQKTFCHLPSSFCLRLT
ncbi:hypothetical protein Xen7305DRAFT_00052250 [Xenococcus sp. PCC 7305]|nr:hypothetical protein Xen7305DRAFT_00052250 [Xenococcus sp. PCC 7305]